MTFTQFLKKHPEYEYMVLARRLSSWPEKSNDIDDYEEALIEIKANGSVVAELYDAWFEYRNPPGTFRTTPQASKSSGRVGGFKRAANA